MQPPKTHEQNVEYLVVLEKQVDEAIAAGEIDKPAYDTLKYYVDRTLHDVWESVAKKHLYNGKGGNIYDLARFSRDEKSWPAVISCAHVSYAREVVSTEKKLAKVKAPELRKHPLFIDIAAMVQRYKPIAEKLIALKDKTVSTASRREQKRTKAEEERKAKFTQYATLVNVLQQHLDDYVKAAGKSAIRDFDGWMKTLEANGWDLDKVAPAPTRDDSGELYTIKMQARGHFISITVPAADDESNSNIRKFSIERKAEYVAGEKDRAHGSYMAWIYKMIQKIGQPVDAAEMSGDPWIQSIVKVTRRDGSKQTWHTQQIINRSKYNRPFYQFPSRLVSEK